VNSDFGYSVGKPEDLTVVRATADRIAAEMGLDVAKAVCRDNAVRFFDNALLREHVKHMETAVNPARTFENPPKKIRV
jgi:hypothetical protein